MNPSKSSKETLSFLEDPHLLEKSAIFYEESNRQKWRNFHTNNRKTGARKGVKTRRYNQVVIKTVEEQLAEEKEAKISFLPYEFQDPSRKISVTDLMKLTREYSEPDQIKIIQDLYKERLSKN